MAEYYPLLAKAVAGLPNSTPEIRRGVYDRARKALLAQLHNLEPPLAESDVERETEALDGAVARLEAELTAVNGHAAEKPKPVPIIAEPAMAEPTVTEPTVTAPPKAPNRTVAPTLSPATRPITPPRRPNGPALAQGTLPPASAPAGSTLPPLPNVARPGLRQNPPEFNEPDDQAQAELRPGKPSERTQKTRTAPPPSQAESLDDYEAGESFNERPYADLQRPRAEGARLYAPQRGGEESRSGVWLWVVGGVVAVVVAIVAVAAWTLRDRPDRLAHLKPVQAQPEKTGKIVDRIGGPKLEEAKPQETKPEETKPQIAATPAQQTTPELTPNTPAPKAADANQTIPVAQRAALLVEAPNEPNKVKTYVGTVIWRLENVSSGAGQPLGTAVHADIDVPGDKMKVALTLQKNMDASLPASHTITVVFTVQPDSPTGGIKQISVPQLRLDDAPTGDPLIGVPVPIMENSFLIGLTRGNAEATNLELIKDRAWFDIPILLGNGKIAKLTFEKNTSGTRAIDEAITAWKAQ